MAEDRTSKVPFTQFPTNLFEQRAALESNELLNRMKQSRKAYEDPHRPQYHYVNPEGRLNDPNGLCYWKDHWHLFYQAYPPEDPRQHWGHAISRDLIHWEDLPYCIYPNPEDKCYSGATLVEDDRVIAMYHGTQAGNMVAISSDPLLLNWEKVGNRPVIPMPDGDAPYNVFDPCIWNSGGKYYSLSAGQTNDGPGGQHVAADFLFESENLSDWTYLHAFVEDDRYTRIGDDGACPYFWPIGDKHVLLFFSHSSGGQYLLGDYDEDRQKFVVTFGEKFNFGPPGPGGVHAPSATPLGDGSVIVIFNMNPAKQADGWNQIMSLPRQLTLAEGGNDILVKPAGDIESLRGDVTELNAFTLPANREIRIHENSSAPDDGLEGNAYELQVDIQPSDASMVELCVLQSPQKEEFTRVSVYRGRGYPDRASYIRKNQTSFVTIDNSYSSVDPGVRCRAPETLEVHIEPDEPIQLRVFVDHSIVEVFVNDRKAVALRVYPSRSDSVGISLRSQGSETEISQLKFWPLGSIY